MEINPYHVRLSISQYGDKLRSELFTEDLGDTEGEFLPAQWQVIEEWLAYLAQGTAGLPPDAARTLGKELFSYLIGGAENGKKWVEILEQVKRQKRPLRLLIDASTDHVRDLPYGLLCEPHDDYFLLRSGGNSNRQPIRVVRILRRCSPRLLNLNRSPLRILIVAAEPISPELPSFECASRLRDLALQLTPRFEVSIISPDGSQLLNKLIAENGAVPDSFFERCCSAHRDIVKAVLAQSEFDILHVIGHGQDGELLLCDLSGGKTSVSPGELGEWCNKSKLQMAFLQVCEASKTASRGCFGGLAQQLINPQGGNLPAAIASSYPLDALGSTSAAVSFYQGISEGHSPDVALERNFDEQNWSWAFLELWIRPSALGGVTSRGAFQFVCPYRGLARFEERHSDIFFGRHAETAELIQILEGESIIAVIGDTGSGKSSLLQAGIVSTVRREGLLGKTGWEIITIEPSGSLRERLITTLKVNAEDPLDAQGDERQLWSDTLLELLNRRCRNSQSLLLIIDQFEEVFTLKENEAELHQLCDILASFAMQHLYSFRLILGMRSEYLGTAITYRGLGKAFGHPWVLSPPAGNDLVKIISEPAKQYGYSFEERLSESANEGSSSLLEEILTDPILTRSTNMKDHMEVIPAISPLPLLEFALERLWLMAVKRGSQQFKYEDYDYFGGLAGAIVKHAEEIYGILPTIFGRNAQAIARQIFTDLVSSSGTRRPRTREELESASIDRGLSREITNYLVGERLLAIRCNFDALELSYVDLIHEVLIERWDRFKNWLAENPELRALIESFKADAKKWSQQFQHSNRASKNLLPNYSQAKQYILWIKATKPSLSNQEERFARALRGVLIRRKVVQGVAAFLTLQALVIVLFLWDQARDREYESRMSLASSLHQKAIVAINDKDMLYGELYAAKALTLEERQEEQLKLRELLLEARAKGAALGLRVNFKGAFLDANPARNLILAKTSEVSLSLFDFRTGKEIRAFNTRSPKISVAALNNAGSLLAYGTEDGEVKVLQVSDETPIYTYKDVSSGRKKIISIAFENNSRSIAFGTESGRIQVYDLNQSTSMTLRGHQEPVQGVAFSSNSKLLASASTDDKVRLWDLTTARELPQSPFEGHEDVVMSAAFSPTNEYVASEATDGTVRLWDAKDGRILQILRKPVANFGTIAFSPDGRLLAAAGEDETIWVFDLKANQEILKIHSYDGEVRKLSFVSDSRTLFVGCESAASIWTVVKNKEVRTLITDHNGPMSSVAFAPDGAILAGASEDSRIYIWDFENMKLQKDFAVTNQGRVNCVAYSPDGRLLATASEEFRKDGTDSPLKLWTVDNDYRELHRFVGYERGVPSIAFSPSQAEPLLATAGGHDYKIKIWDFSSYAPVRELHDNQRLFSVAFSGDGRYIAYGRYDNVVKFCEVKDNEMPKRLYNHKEGLYGIWGLTFSPDQQLLASGSADKSILVWNLKEGKELSRLTEHTGSIYSMVFNPTGTWLASASADNTVRLWNVENNQSIALKAHDRPVWWVSFSRDGAWLASCGLDKKIEVWNMNEINSVYISSPQYLFEETKRETGLDITTDRIFLSRK